MRSKESARALVSQGCGGFVSTCACAGSEAMIEPRIIPQGYLRMVIQRCVNRGLSVWSDKMIRGRDVQCQRACDRGGFIEHRVDHHPVIADCGINLCARGGHIGQAATQTKTNNTCFFNELRVAPDKDGGDVGNAMLSTVLLHIAKCLLQLMGHIGVQLNARGKPPEDIGRHGQVAECSPFIDFAAYPFVEAEDLGNDDDGRSRRCNRLGDIGGDGP